MNINIFLKQFRLENNEIVKLIAEGNENKLGLEKLIGLMKILPETDEVSAASCHCNAWWVPNRNH